MLWPRRGIPRLFPGNIDTTMFDIPGRSGEGLHVMAAVAPSSVMKAEDVTVSDTWTPSVAPGR